MSLSLKTLKHRQEMLELVIFSSLLVCFLNFFIFRSNRFHVPRQRGEEVGQITKNENAVFESKKTNKVSIRKSNFEFVACIFFCCGV